jgi:NADPH:quinone reductase-like Zn-dependent oxidoreductase
VTASSATPRTPAEWDEWVSAGRTRNWCGDDRSTLVKVPDSGHSNETMRSLLALSDVMCCGHHAAVSAAVKPGSVVAVVGDGAVGLCAVVAAKRLGAARTHRPQQEPGAAGARARVRRHRQLKRRFFLVTRWD